MALFRYLWFNLEFNLVVRLFCWLGVAFLLLFWVLWHFFRYLWFNLEFNLFVPAKTKPKRKVHFHRNFVFSAQTYWRSVPKKCAKLNCETFATFYWNGPRFRRLFLSNKRNVASRQTSLPLNKTFRNKLEHFASNTPMAFASSNTTFLRSLFVWVRLIVRVIKILKVKSTEITHL